MWLLHEWHAHGGDGRLLAWNPDPNDVEIRAGISGNLCRCTGYQSIVAAIRAAAAAEN